MANIQIGFANFSGESSESKPSETNIGAGATFYETDTKKSFVFDGTASAWKETASQNNTIMYLGVHTLPRPDSTCYNRNVCKRYK